MQKISASLKAFGTAQSSNMLPSLNLQNLQNLNLTQTIACLLQAHCVRVALQASDRVWCVGDLKSCSLWSKPTCFAIKHTPRSFLFPSNGAANEDGHEETGSASLDSVVLHVWKGMRAHVGENNRARVEGQHFHSEAIHTSCLCYDRCFTCCQ